MASWRQVVGVKSVSQLCIGERHTGRHFSVFRCEDTALATRLLSRLVLAVKVEVENQGEATLSHLHSPLQES